MVPRWRFLGPAFQASHLQHISDLHSKFALGPRHVQKYGKTSSLRPLRLGEEKERRKKEKKKKSQDENLMACPIPQGRDAIITINRKFLQHDVKCSQMCQCEECELINSLQVSFAGRPTQFQTSTEFSNCIIVVLVFVVHRHIPVLQIPVTRTNSLLTRRPSSADRTARREFHACICFYDIQWKPITVFRLY